MATCTDEQQPLNHWETFNPFYFHSIFVPVLVFLVIGYGGCQYRVENSPSTRRLPSAYWRVGQVDKNSHLRITIILCLLNDKKIEFLLILFGFFLLLLFYHSLVMVGINPAEL